MNTRKIIWLASLILISMQYQLLAQGEKQLSQTFGTALSQGDVNGLINLLDEEVELMQPGEGGKYRKQVVSGKLAEFLKKNPPASFLVKHQGSSADGQIYAIGQLTTQSGNHYKVLMRAKPAGAHYRIFKLDLLQH